MRSLNISTGPNHINFPKHIPKHTQYILWYVCYGARTGCRMCLGCGYLGWRCVLALVNTQYFYFHPNTHIPNYISPPPYQNPHLHSHNPTTQPKHIFCKHTRPTHFKCPHTHSAHGDLQSCRHTISRHAIMWTNDMSLNPVLSPAAFPCLAYAQVYAAMDRQCATVGRTRQFPSNP